MQRQLEYQSANSPNQQSKTLTLPMQPAHNRYSSPAETRNQAQTKERTPGAAEFTTPTKSTKMDVDDGEGYRTPEKRYEGTMVSGFDRHRHESFFRRPSKKESADRPNYSELIAKHGC